MTLLHPGWTLPALASALLHGSIYPPPPPLPPVGGHYRGPGDTVPGEQAPGPGPGGSPAVPGSGLDATRAGPSTPLAPPLAATRSATTPAAATSVSLSQEFDLSSWSWWWEFNKEPFLALRSHLERGPTGTGVDGHYLGRGARSLAGSAPASPGMDVLPALLDTLRGTRSNDVATACLIAVARVGRARPDRERDELARELRPYLSDPNQEVSETATVSLGLLGTESAALLLGDLLLDEPAGREAVERSRGVPERTRAFAAYALGLLGARTENEDVRRYVVHVLIRALRAEKHALPDLPVACVVSLARVPLSWSRSGSDAAADPADAPATSSREAQLAFLLERLEDEREHRTVRAHVPVSLAVLLGADTAPPQRGVLRDRVLTELLQRFPHRARETNEFRQSTALAFGILADCSDRAVDVRVRRALREERGNRLARSFALLSLGRVGARADPGQEQAAAEVRQHLLTRLGGSDDLSRWAALGLALMERGRRAARGPGSAETIVAALHTRLRESSSPADVGALSIACGLAGSPVFAETLLERLESGEERARAYAALGLGLIRAEEAVGPLREVLGESTYRPLLLRETAIALGLLGDGAVLGLMMEQLQATRSLAARAGLAQAIGRIGNPGVLPDLLELVQDPELSDAARAFAVIAIGRVVDPAELPWNTALAVDLNYAAAPPTLYDGVGFGILNIL